MSYYYEFKGTIYFRKRIHQKYLKDRRNALVYRRSLKLCVSKKFYDFLLCHKNILDKLTNYINRNITKYLNEANKMSVSDINQMIIIICEEYREEAKIENTDLEDKRLEALEYTDNNNIVHQGYLLQSICREYKILDDNYKDLNDKSRIRKLGIKISKRTNINMEKILELDKQNQDRFYELLVKSERDVVSNDIKNYIKRNFPKFRHLVSPDVEKEEDKVYDAHYEFIDLIESNPMQDDYEFFLKGLKNPVRKKFEDNVKPTQDIANEFLESKSLPVQTKKIDDPFQLIDKFIAFTRYKSVKNKRNELRFFAEFVKGDNKKYPERNFNELNYNDVMEFEEVLSECTPKNRSFNKLNIFELAEQRKKEIGVRLSTTYVKNIKSSVKKFVKHLKKYYYEDLNTSDYDVFDPVSLIYTKNEECGYIEKELRKFYKEELQVLIDNSFREEKLKGYLNNYPYYFYAFCFYVFLGTRINEFWNIRLDSIKVQEINGEKIYYIWLNENHPEQSLKNQNAHRNIVIPNLLIDLGLLNYINSRFNTKEEWLWNRNPSGYGTISTFFRRELDKHFPDNVYSTENKLKGEVSSFIQMRSLRKNFVEYSFEENKTTYHTIVNHKKLVGHDEGTTTQKYLGRLEPFKAKVILDSNEDYGLNLNTLKETISNYYKEINREIPHIKQKFEEEWGEISPVRPTTSRR